ncbi:MAG: hypothetical protein ACREIC_32710, partial [Limisphaerales bacterium]
IYNAGTAGKAGLGQTNASPGAYFQNSYGLQSASNVITFSEFSPAPNTIITTQYQAYGVTFTPYVYYASIYNQTSGTPHLDPAASVANFVQNGPVVPTFSVLFDRPVSAAAFAMLSQPGTFQMTALWAGTEVAGGPHTFTGGYGPDRTTNFVGLSGVTFDELRVSNIATSDGALVLDNLQVAPVLVNSWTNPVSGRWDAASNWSFGTLPASNQTVEIANDGYKGVNVDSATFANFPASVTVSNLVVSARTNALSTLLLNYAGLNAPLKVLNDCRIGPNGTIDNFSSDFEVDGNAGGQLLVDGGNFTQVGGQTVVNAPVFVRSGGAVNATNGNLTLGNVTLGDSNSAGRFKQDGGSIAAQKLTIQNGGYTLNSGILYGIGGTEIDEFGGYLQWGGTNYGDVTVNNASSGCYTMDRGLAQGNLFTIRGSFYQGGGVVDMQTVDWTGNNGNVLNQGVLRSRVMNIHANALVFMGQVSTIPGSVETDFLNISNSARVEVGGYDLFITNNLDLRGDSTNSPANLNLIASMVRVGSITIHGFSGAEQGPGTTNELTSGLTLEGGGYLMTGWLLEGPSIGVGSNATFGQLGGQDAVHGVLSITGTYYSSGCSLVADGLYLRGSLLLVPTNNVTSFTNNGLVDLGGTLSTGWINTWGGQVQLSTDATINFLGSHAQIRFAPSSAVSWTPG